MSQGLVARIRGTRHVHSLLFPAILDSVIPLPEAITVSCGAVTFSPVPGRFHGDSQLLKYYIFWGLFALVLIGIGFSLWDRHRRSRKAKELEEAYRAGVAAAAQAKPVVDAVAKPHATSPLEAAFDPHATRIHFRGSAAEAASAPSNRDAASLPPGKIARLLCVGGDQKHRSFPVTAAGVTVGRDPKNDIVIADPRVSYHHAWIGIIDQRVVLRDLGSTNGTFLNARIDSPVSEAVLSPDDTIFFGGHGRDQFRFVVD